jgi:predicted secreted Zn-dependent protease
MSENTPALGDIDWSVSRTCDSGACVGVARRGESVFIANTSNPESPVSTFTTREWQQFLAGAKLGDFDGIA